MEGEEQIMESQIRAFKNGETLSELDLKKMRGELGEAGGGAGAPND